VQLHEKQEEEKEEEEEGEVRLGFRR